MIRKLLFLIALIASLVLPSLQLDKYCETEYKMQTAQAPSDLLLLPNSVGEKNLLAQKAVQDVPSKQNPLVHKAVKTWETQETRET